LPTLEALLFENNELLSSPRFSVFYKGIIYFVCFIHVTPKLHDDNTRYHIFMVEILNVFFDKKGSIIKLELSDMKLGFGLYRHMLNDQHFRFAKQGGASHLVIHLVDYFNNAKNDISTANQPIGGNSGWGGERGIRVVAVGNAAGI
jgi:hypothetical protein